MTASLRYRVWCLSWEDAAEQGSDVVAYDILNHDPAREERGVIYVPNIALGTPAEAAEAYADYAHDNRDGWESTWPLVFRVRCPDGQFVDFEVDRDYVVEFSAAPAKGTNTPVIEASDAGPLSWLMQDKRVQSNYRGKFVAVSGPPYKIVAVAATLAELMDGFDDVTGLYFHQFFDTPAEESSP